MRKRDGRCSVRFASVLSVLTLLAAGLVLPTGSAGAAQPSGTPIKIGYLMTKTGPTDIDNEPSFAAAVKWINAHGGVAGHPVTLISDFESGDVAVSVADAKKLIGDGVDAMVDSDANDSAWASIPEKAGVPVFLSADTLAFAGSDDAFGAPQVVTVTTPLIMLAAKKFGGADKLAVLYCTEYSQCSQAVPYYSSIGKKYDVHVVYSAAASQSAPNYLAQCLAAKAAGANSLFVASSVGCGHAGGQGLCQTGVHAAPPRGVGLVPEVLRWKSRNEWDDRIRPKRSVLRHERARNQDHDRGL